MRRFGEPVLADQRYTLRPGVYAILHHSHELLVTHQAAPEPEYQLPGGGIDPGEHPIQALHREVLEETGWRISRLRKIAAYRRFTYMPEYEIWAEKVCHIYAGRPTSQFTKSLESGHTAVWMQPDAALSALASEGDREILKAFIASIR